METKERPMPPDTDGGLPPVRRIVTGYDATGRAIVTMDGAAPNRAAPATTLFSRRRKVRGSAPSTSHPARPGACTGPIPPITSFA